MFIGSFVGKYVKKVGIRNFNFIGCGMILLAWASLFFCGNNYAGIITGVILIVFGWFIILLLEVIGAKLCEA